jgi:putative ABC transport system permease protein
MNDLLRGAWRTFRAQRARAILTLLGVMIGTGSIVMLAGLLRGAEEALLGMNQGLSSTDILRFRKEEPPPNQARKTQRVLSRLDGQALGNSRALGGAEVLTEATREARATRGGKEKRVRLVGATPEAQRNYRLSLARGRFLDEEDLRLGRRVAVLGHEVWEELLERGDVLGTQLHIDGQSWTIVGVLEHKPSMGHGDGTWMWDRKVLVSEVAFAAAFDPAHSIDSLLLRVGGGAPSATVQAVGSVADQILLRRHLGVRNFKLQDRQGQKQEDLIIGIIEVLLIGTGLMSLFVGGINIMNIMLVTVTERTKEIGLRRAIGAGPRAILAQFLVEASAISLVGGVLGVSLGIGFSWILAAMLRQALGSWSFHVIPWAVALALGLALLTGVAFGLFPAWRAARLDPVDALRYE